MIENDTVRLLRECDAGIKMGVGTIGDVIDYVSSPRLADILKSGKDDHEKIMSEVQTLLDSYHDGGKEPPVMAKGMSKVKTNVKMAMKESDNTIADLVTDGCNMGVKTLNRYLNEYAAADEKSKDITARLISLESHMAEDMRQFL